MGAAAAAFPTGVCDWGQARPDEEPGLVWPTFEDGPRGASLGAVPTSVPLSAGARTQRVAGEDRIATAVAISQANHDAAATVVVARADEAADALAGGPLASALGAPLLLTGRDALPAVVAEELTRLGARHAVVLGGTAAVAPAVVAQVEAAGLRVRRLAGADRFATAAAIAGDLGHRDLVVLAAGDGTMADALAGGALGGRRRTGAARAPRRAARGDRRSTHGPHPRAAPRR